MKHCPTVTKIVHVSSKDEEKLAAFLKDVFPVWMGFFENIVKTHGKNGHASGDSMSLADVAIFSMGMDFLCKLGSYI